MARWCTDPGCLLRIFPKYPLSFCPSPQIIAMSSLLSLPMLSSSHLFHHHFSEESPRALPLSLGWPHCQVEGIFSPDSLFTSPDVGKGHHLHWESCPECKALRHRAGVGSPRQRGPGTHPSAGLFELQMLNMEHFRPHNEDLLSKPNSLRSDTH